MSRKTIPAPGIYKATYLYDETRPSYNCVTVLHYGQGSTMGDCYICDEEGRVNPSFPQPVSVNAEMVGEEVIPK